jgi:D-alanine-D-alanine ligase
MDFLKNKDKYHVWVLAPFLESEDENINYFLDYTQSIAEYTKVFDEIGCSWTWVNVTMSNVETVMTDIKNQTAKTNIVINLCDGDEINGSPGVNVIHALEKNGLIYTGSDAHFYDITTSKIPMKAAFDAHKVATPAWKIITDDTQIEGIFDEVAPLLIIKPAVSGGSMGLSLKNVVDTEGAFSIVLHDLKQGYHGWKLDTDGIFVEEFIKGREFTTFLVGSDYENLIFYPPVERVFHESLPEKEQFLSFDRLWETYNEETPLPNEGHLYEYAEVSTDLLPALQDITARAYKAVGGKGYGRMDIRMDRQTGAMFVLEANAQCGISEDENYTSIGAILRFANKSFTQLIIEILQDALNRHHNN